MRPLRPTCKFSNAHYAHYFLHCDSSLFAAEDIFAIICSSRSFAVCRFLCFYSSQHRKLSICFSDQLAACMFLCRDQFNLQEKNRHNFSPFFPSSSRCLQLVNCSLPANSQLATARWKSLTSSTHKIDTLNNIFSLLFSSPLIFASRDLIEWLRMLSWAVVGERHKLAGP